MSNEATQLALVYSSADYGGAIGNSDGYRFETCVMHPGERVSRAVAWPQRYPMGDAWWDVFYGLCSHCLTKLRDKPPYQLMIDFEVKVRMNKIKEKKNAAS